MKKKIALFIFFVFSLRLMSNSGENVNLANIATASSVGSSGVSIIRHTYNAGRFVKETIWPSEKEELKQKKSLILLRILAAEEQLNQCLINNALHPERNEIFKCKCKSESDELAMAAGYADLNLKKQEFIGALHRLEEKYLPKKVSIQKNGTSVTGIIINGTFIAGGIALAVLATTMTANPLIGYGIVSSCFPVVAAPSVATGIAVTSITTTGVATQGLLVNGLVAAGGAITKAKVAETIVVIGGVMDKAALAISVGEYLRPYIYRNNEEELEYQIKLRAMRASLYERIKEKYFSNKE